MFVRVNALTTSLTEEDLEAIVTKGLDGVVLPKSEDEQDLLKLDTLLLAAERRAKIPLNSVKIIPLIESAKGVINLLQMAKSSKRIVALAFGAGDYCRDLGLDVAQISREEVELLYPRSHIVNVSKATGVQAIDTPFLGLLTDRVRFLEEVRLAATLGFNGKQCIHPSQIEPINTAFTPSSSEIEQARRLVQAFEEAKSRGIGAISFEGRMVDEMSYQQAKQRLSLSELIENRVKQKRAPYISVPEIFERRER